MAGMTTTDLIDELFELHARMEDALLAGHDLEYLSSLRGEAEALLLNYWPRPIPVSERLPDVDGEYLVFAASTSQWMTTDFCKHDFQESHGFNCFRPTHWLPMPPPPI